MTRPAGVPDITTVEDYRRRIVELEDQLREAQETLEAIRSGEVDAVLVSGALGAEQVYTLESADRPYRILIEHMREGALTLTPDGVVLYCNHALADLLGMSPERVVGTDFASFVAATDRGRFREIARRLGRGEVGLSPGQGDSIPIQVSFADLREDGQPVLGCVVTNLTEARRYGRELAEIEARHAADEAVREREARYRLVLESATDYAIIATDLEGRVTLWNTGARNILGWEETEIVGQPAPLIWTEEDRAAGVPEAEMRGAREHGRAEDERWHLRKDDSRFWAHGLLMPLLGDDGLLLGYLKILRDRTAQREAEEVLLRTEERYRLAARATNDAIWDWDLVTNGVGWNEALQEAYGHVPADVEPTGDWWIAHIHPEDLGRIDASIHAIIDGTGTAWDDEYRFLRADGTYADVLDRGFVIRDEDGRAVRMIGAMLDLSSRRRAEVALAESEERLRLATEAAEVGFWDVDVVNDVLVWPPRVKAMFGISSDTPVSMADFYEGLHPEDRERTGEAYAAAADPERRALYDVEYRTVGKEDGIVRWVAAKGRGVFDASGRCLRVIGTALDVTARKKAEAELVRTNALLGAVMEAVPGVVYAKDRRGRILAANRGTAELIGKPPGDFIGLTDLDVLDDKDEAEAVMANDRRIMEENRSEIVEESVRGPDGTPIVWLSTKAPFRDAQGTVIGLIGSSVDITERKRVEERLRELNETLETRVAEEVAERTKAEEALRQSQKMEAVGQLTGGLAHDFNNLLAGISGSLEMMQTRMTQGRLGDLDRYIAAAQGASKRAAALTHRLLAFSRRQTLDPKPTDVNRLVAGMEDLVRRTIGPAVELEVVAAGGLWSTFVDPGQLENALLNLCINARDAMPDGGRITIETANKWLDERAARERDLEPGQYLSLCITDTGTGMPPEVVAKVFDPFFTTKPIGQGTGLGLSMVYGFVRQSGGQVRIYSEIGQGTTMCLYLPRHYGEAQEADAPAGLDEAPRAEQGQTVLIVDDEPTVRMLLTDVLEDLGYLAIEAADGPSGLKVLRSDARIDLLVTDVGLPGGMNGRQLADAGRVVRANLKVLFITGYAENAVIGNGHLEPGMQVLTKPFVMETLASRIKELIDAP